MRLFKFINGVYKFFYHFIRTMRIKNSWYFGLQEDIQDDGVIGWEILGKYGRWWWR